MFGTLGTSSPNHCAQHHARKWLQHGLMNESTILAWFVRNVSLLYVPSINTYTALKQRDMTTLARLPIICFLSMHGDTCFEILLIPWQNIVIAIILIPNGRLLFDLSLLQHPSCRWARCELWRIRAYFSQACKWHWKCLGYDDTLGWPSLYEESLVRFWKNVLLGESWWR